MFSPNLAGTYFVSLTPQKTYIEMESFLSTILKTIISSLAIQIRKFNLKFIYGVISLHHIYTKLIPMIPSLIFLFLQSDLFLLLMHKYILNHWQFSSSIQEVQTQESSASSHVFRFDQYVNVYILITVRPFFLSSWRISILYFRLPPVILVSSFNQLQALS